ncbi:hypothetical protein [Emcibacter sp. SYSU 3D8]|uniref:hypothetical protein n=1 Tax=Emcibacter sp. SYSU 3D8 TaxID=3133969 RepID=UPI0031FF152D
MAGNSSLTRMGWIAAGVIILGGILYWQLRPWADDAERARLAGLRDQLAAFYETHPPVPGWRITAIDVAPPGIVVALEMPAKTADALQLRPAVYRLQAAGAICPEPGDPIYSQLGEFSLEIHPFADGKPVLVQADCRKVRQMAPVSP